MSTLPTSHSRPGRSPAISSSTERWLRSSTLKVIWVGVLNMRTWRGARRDTAERRVLRPLQRRATARARSRVCASGSVIGAPSSSSTWYRSRLKPSPVGDDARIDDVEAQLIEHRGGAREAVTPRAARRSSTAVVPRTLRGSTRHQRLIRRRARARPAARVCQAISSGVCCRKYAAEKRAQARSMSCCGDAALEQQPRAPRPGSRGSARSWSIGLSSPRRSARFTRS